MTPDARATTVRRWTDVVEAGWPERHWIGEYLTIDGATWYARIDGRGRPELPPVVMIHGLVVSGAYFRPVATYLDDDLRLYVPDLPGFGRSTSSSGVWSLTDHADGLATWMGAHGLSEAVLVANSLGCQIATLLAVRHPELVRSLVLVAPTIDPERASVLAIAAGALRDVPRERQSLWSIWVPDFFRSGVRRAVQSLRAGLADPQEARLAQIAQPVLVVGGERDPIISDVWAHAMAGKIPRGEAIILKDAAHAMNYSDPRALANVIHRAVHLSSSGED